MIRIILWKLGFEWAHLKRIFAPEIDNKVYYFAFGANLSPTVLERRRITVFDSIDLILHDADLQFSQVGFYKDHGYASADPVIGKKMYGKLYLILKRDAERMDFFEGVPFLKVHHKIQHTFEDKNYFYYRAVTTRKGLKPTREYLDYLVDAYTKMSIVPQDYIQDLAKTDILSQFLPQDQTGSFVRDISRWPKPLHPVLKVYEGLCLRCVESLWNRSLVQWAIKT